MYWRLGNMKNAIYDLQISQDEKFEALLKQNALLEA
jgi:hypothetical protein